MAFHTLRIENVMNRVLRENNVHNIVANMSLPFKLKLQLIIIISNLMQLEMSQMSLLCMLVLQTCCLLSLENGSMVDTWNIISCP